MRRVIRVTFAAFVCTIALVSARDPVLAEAPHSTPPDPYATIHSVAVVSAAGDRLMLQTKGLTAFAGFGEQGIPIPDWHIDDWIVSVLSQSLATRFTVKQVPVDINALSQCDPARGCTMMFKRDAGVDAFVVVRKYSDIGPMNSAIPIKGIGVYFSSIVFSKYNPTFHANYIVEVIDARTGKVLGSGLSHLGGTTLLGGNYPAEVFATTNDWPNTWAELSTAQQTMVKGTLGNLVMESLPPAMKDAGLPPPASNLPILFSPATDPTQAGAVAKIHSVAIVSAVGDEFDFFDPGNDFSKMTSVQTAAPADWGIDGKVEAAARVVLFRHFAVKDATFDRAALSKITYFIDDSSLAPLPLVPSKAVDAYVLFVKAGAHGMPSRALGLWHWTPVFNREAAVYAEYAVVLVDARTLKVLTIYPAGPEPIAGCELSRRYSNGVVQCMVDEKLWPETPDKLSKDAASEVEQKLDNILSASVPNVLFQSGLDPAGQSVAAH